MITAREAAELQALLVGVRLPAGKQELIDYARSQGGDRFIPQLEQLSDREYASLDEVGEALHPVQPLSTQPHPLPEPESGEPPGGSNYTA